MAASLVDRRLLPDEFGPREIRFHVIRKPHQPVAGLVMEVQSRLGRLATVAVRPQRIESGMCVQRPPHVRVIIRTVARKLPLLLPRLALIKARPDRHLAAGIERLRTCFGRTDDVPRPVRFNVKTTNDGTWAISKPILHSQRFDQYLNGNNR